MLLYIGYHLSKSPKLFPIGTTTIAWISKHLPSCLSYFQSSLKCAWWIYVLTGSSLLNYNADKVFFYFFVSSNIYYAASLHMLNAFIWNYMLFSYNKCMPIFQLMTLSNNLVLLNGWRRSFIFQYSVVNFRKNYPRAPKNLLNLQKHT